MSRNYRFACRPARLRVSQPHWQADAMSSSRAGQPATAGDLVDVAKLVTA